MAQIAGEAGSSVSREESGQGTEGEAEQRTENKLQSIFPYGAEITLFHAEIHDVGQNQGDHDLHVHLSDHTQGAEQRGQLILPETPGESFNHV